MRCSGGGKRGDHRATQVGCAWWAPSSRWVRCAPPAQAPPPRRGGLTKGASDQVRATQSRPADTIPHHARTHPGQLQDVEARFLATFEPSSSLAEHTNPSTQSGVSCVFPPRVYITHSSGSISRDSALHPAGGALRHPTLRSFQLHCLLSLSGGA